MAPHSTACQAFLLGGPPPPLCGYGLPRQGTGLDKCRSCAWKGPPYRALLGFSLTIGPYGRHLSKARCVFDADIPKKGSRKRKRTKRIKRELLDRQRKEERIATVKLAGGEDGVGNVSDVRGAWKLPAAVAAALVAGAASTLFLGPFVLPDSHLWKLQVEDDISMERIVARQLSKRLQEMPPDQLAAVLKDIVGPGKLSAPDLKLSAAPASQNLQELSSAEVDREQDVRTDQDMTETREADNRLLKQAPNEVPPPNLSRFKGAESIVGVEGGRKERRERGYPDADSVLAGGRSHGGDRGKQEGALSDTRENMQSTKLSAGAAVQDRSRNEEEAGADISMQETQPYGEEDDVTLERLRLAGIDVDSLLALRPKNRGEVATPLDTGSAGDQKPLESSDGPLEAAVQQVKGPGLDLDDFFAPARGALRSVEFEKALHEAQAAIKHSGAAQVLETVKERCLHALEGLKLQELPLQAAVVAGSALTLSLVAKALQRVRQGEDGDRAKDLMRKQEGEDERVAWKRMKAEPSGLHPATSQDRKEKTVSVERKSGLPAEPPRSEKNVSTRGAHAEPLWVRQNDAAPFDIGRSSTVEERERMPAVDLEEQSPRGTEGTSRQGEDVFESGDERYTENGQQQGYAKAWSSPRINNGQKQEQLSQEHPRQKPSVDPRLSNKAAETFSPLTGQRFRGGVDRQRISESGSVMQLLSRRRPKHGSRGLEFLQGKGGGKRELGQAKRDDVKDRESGAAVQPTAGMRGEANTRGKVGSRRVAEQKSSEDRRRVEGEVKLAPVASGGLTGMGVNGKIGPEAGLQGPAVLQAGGAVDRSMAGEKETVLEGEGSPTRQHIQAVATSREDGSFGDVSTAEPLSSLHEKGGGTVSACDNRSEDDLLKRFNGKGTDRSQRAAFMQREQETRSEGPSRGLHVWSTEKGDGEPLRSPVLLAVPKGRSYARHAVIRTRSAKEPQDLEEGLHPDLGTESLLARTSDSQNGSVARDRAPSQRPRSRLGQLEERQNRRQYARVSLGSSSAHGGGNLEAKADPRRSKRTASSRTGLEASKGQSESSRLNGEFVHKSVKLSQDEMGVNSQAATPGSADRISDEIKGDEWREAFRLSRLDVWAEKSV